MWLCAGRELANLDGENARLVEANEVLRKQLRNLQLKKENEIRDKKLLIKTGIMLTVVILGFFLHPVIHMDPVWVAISGAIVIFALDNHHDLEE